MASARSLNCVALGCARWLSEPAIRRRPGVLDWPGIAASGGRARAGSGGGSQLSGWGLTQIVRFYVGLKKTHLRAEEGVLLNYSRIYGLCCLKNGKWRETNGDFRMM